MEAVRSASYIDPQPPSALTRLVQYGRPSSHASAALASSTSQLAAPAPIDVETTNWNAVKILAVQHDIPLALLESIRDTVTADPTADFTSHDFGLTTPLRSPPSTRLWPRRLSIPLSSSRPRRSCYHTLASACQASGTSSTTTRHPALQLIRCSLDS